MSYLDKFFKNKAVVLIFIGFLIGAAFSPLFVSATDYASKHGEDSSNTTWETTGQGMISTSKDGRLFNATGADLQNAVWYLNSTNGGTVWIPEGNITISAPSINITSHVDIIGVGNASILYLNDDVGDPIFRCHNVYNIRIANLNLDGNQKGQISDGGNTHAILISGTGHNITIENCYIHNTWDDGIRGSRNTYQIYINKCIFFNCGNWTENVYPGGDDNGYPGGILIQGDYCHIVDCHFDRCYTGGILLDGVTNPASFNVMDENTITRSGSGIATEGGIGSSDNVISNNIIYNLNSTCWANNQSTGIKAGGPNVTIIGNVIKDCDDGYGINLGGINGVCNGNIISGIDAGPTINRGAGIFVSAAANSIVSNNRINDTSDRGIRIYQSENCSVIGNIIDIGNVDDAGINFGLSSSNGICTGNIINGGLYGVVIDTTSHNIVISDNYFREPYREGVRLYKTKNITVNNNIFFKCDESVLRGNVFVDDVNGVIITNNLMLDSYNHNIVLQYGNNVTISNNIIKNGTGTGIIVQVTSHDVMISGNIISGGVGKNGISLSNDCDYVSIVNNNIRNIGGTIVTDTSSGTHNKFINNIGYTTEYGNARSGVSDGGTIAHNLTTTPTYVLATGSVANETITVTAIGAATFTVAIKNVTGAGTTQTIYWRAYV